MALASGLDVAGLLPAQASEVARLCGQIEASASALKVLAAARAAEGSSWRDEGFRSPSEQFAHHQHTSPGVAKRGLAAGKRLAKHPAVAQAALQGSLSSEQASLIAEGADADPSKTGALLEAAKTKSVPELSEEVARVKAAVADEHQRQRERHARRSWRTWVDRDGTAHGHLIGHPEDALRIGQALDPLRRRLNSLRRQAALAAGIACEDLVLDTLEALDYDALLLLTNLALGARDSEMPLDEVVAAGLFPQFKDLIEGRGGLDRSPGADGGSAKSMVGESARPDPVDVTVSSTGSPVLPGFDDRVSATSLGDLVGAHTSTASSALGSAQSGRRKGRKARPKAAKPGLVGRQTKVFVRVDLDALLRGCAEEGELSEIDGFGPVPVSAIRHLIETEHPFVVGVLTKGKDIMRVYHHGRAMSAHQRSAVEFLQSSCSVQGCNARRGLENDHREDWAQTHFTVAEGMDRLCAHHHALKTRKGWALVGSAGKRPFVPPTDPRHPRYRGAAASRGAPGRLQSERGPQFEASG